MQRLLLLMLLLLPPLATSQSSQAACPASQVHSSWHNCVGTRVWPSGARYVGEWRAGRQHGEGIEYKADGTVDRAGRWDNGPLITAYFVEPRLYPFEGAAAKVESTTPSATTSGSLLPLCPTERPTEAWHECFGTKRWPSGARYVGEWRAGRQHGEGIDYRADGTVDRSGRWENGPLAAAYSIDPRLFPFSGAIDHTAIEGRRPAQDDLRLEIEAERKKRQDVEQRLAAAEARERERLQAQAQSTPQPPRPQAALRPERRVALIVGNAAYQNSPLDNPVNDATDVDAGLKRAGFQTTLLRNATLAQMREATRRFADLLPTADVALIYFAGHGIESKGRNYMVPVNADLKFEYKLSDQTYDAGNWLEMLEGVRSTNADRVNIVILDACRNNNLIGARSLSRGLGRLDAPTGTFLAYSTAPGKVAADGPRGQRNSPFTKHLLQAMQQANLPIEEVFKEVRRNVSRGTAGAQVPWESTSLTGFFSFRPER